MGGGRAVEQRVVFDEVAELYERARPRYPAPVVDEVRRRAGLTPASRILEVGCGPAIATPSFAERGYAMVCLEPGPRMAARARTRLEPFPQVTVETTTFEDWEPVGRSFDLVLAAQSFHWVDPSVRFAKAAALLRPGGGLAILANLPQRGESDVRAALDRVYVRFADAFVAHRQVSGAAARARLDELLDAAPEFGPCSTWSHRWTARYDTAGYLELMRTQSDHRMLPEETLAELLAEIGDAVDAHGGSIDVEYEARLLFARTVSEELGGTAHRGQSDDRDG